MPPAPTAGRGFSPLDEELALWPGALSPRLAQSVIRLGTWLPFEQVSRALHFFTGVTVSPETARRLTETAGAALVSVERATVARLEQEAPQGAVGPAVQQLSVDGAMVPLVHGEWAEVKTVAVGVVLPLADQTGSRQGRATDLSYFSRLDTAEEFTRLALGELHRRGTATAGLVCAVNDGAAWIQGFVDYHRPDAVRILDFPHAAEHLSGAANAVWGLGAAAGSAWLGVQLHQLKHGDPDLALAALRALPVERDQVLRYLEARRGQLCYAQWVAQGYPIGSGSVESANKLVVQARLKGSGMHWARQNVNPMVALRGVACSDRWEVGWPAISQHLRSERARCRGARQAERQAARKLTVPATASAPQPHARATPLAHPKLVDAAHPTKEHPWKRPLLAGGRAHNAALAKS
jgi:hypothetical protein